VQLRFRVQKFWEISEPEPRTLGSKLDHGRSSIKLESFVVVHKHPSNIRVLGYDACVSWKVNPTLPIGEQVGKHLRIERWVVENGFRGTGMAYGLVVCKLGPGPKAPALAWLHTAQAYQKPEPGPNQGSCKVGPSSGSGPGFKTTIFL
jgi:hypothetical protein